MMVKQLSQGMPQQPGADMQESPQIPLDFQAALQPALRGGINAAYSEGSRQDFVSRMQPFAAQASRETGVPMQLMLGQAALESGWGKREIRMPDGSTSYNLFGIKATAEWKGKVAEVMTTEYRNGQAHKQVERFRAYDSYADAFRDHARLISDTPRYAEVLRQSGNPAAMATAIQQAGYATDPNYADKLVRVMGMLQADT